MKQKSFPKAPSSAIRILLLTDWVGTSRSRRALADAGLSVLATCREGSDTFREVMETQRPDLVLISSAHSLFPSTDLCAYFESNPTALTLIHVSSNCWSSNTGSEPEKMTARGRVSDINRIARFLQIARQETVPAVDFADLGAWLSMVPFDSSIRFMEHRICPSEAATARQHLVPALQGNSRKSTHRFGAFCILSPIREGILSALDWVANEMVSAGIAVVLGTVVPCQSLPRKAMRLIIGILTPPVFPREPTQRKITRPARHEKRTLEGVSP